MQKANPKKNLREPQHQPRPGIEKKMKPVPVSDQPEAVSAKLAGKVVLITGGDSGIGKAVAILFAKEGADVAISYLNEHIDARDTKKSIEKEYERRCLLLPGDISKESTCKKIIEKTIKEFGKIDVLINNAALHYEAKSIEKITTAHLKKTFEVNVFSFFYITKFALPHMKKESAIINTSSILSIVPSLLEATYSASKTALSFYTKSLRKHLEIINSRVKVFELLPPLVATEMTIARNDKKISTEELVKALILGLEKDQYTIRVGDTKLIYLLNRFFPKLTFDLINPKKANQYLKS